MKFNQELKKYLSDKHAIPESSLEKYVSSRPQALEIKDSNIYLDGIIVDSMTAKMYESFGLDMNFITPSNVREALQKFNSDITMWINSPGGSVFDASSILTAMQSFQENYKINVIVDGLAASAATYLAVHGNDRKIAKMGFFMIHNSWTFAIGDSDDMIRAGNTLDKIDGTYSEMMAEKSNMSADEIRDAMKNETWFSAQEAIDAGFMDAVYEPSKIDDKNKMKQSSTQKLTSSILALNELRGYC